MFLPKAVIDDPKLEQKPNYFDNGGKKQGRTGKSFASNHNPGEPSFILYISTNDIFSIVCHQMEKTPWMNDTLKNFMDYERVEEEKPSQIPV